MTGARSGEWNERSKAIAKATFRVGSITLPPTFLPSAINQASATGENPCVHQSTIGWEVGGKWLLAPIGERSADACSYKSEKQAEVSGLTAEWSVPTPRHRRGGGEKRERSRQR